MGWRRPRQISARCRRDLPAGCRLADHGQRLAGWYVWGMGRGAGLGWFNSFNAATSAS
tara:strand:+ start:1961 stop:2134 length:174 start_codon:yes stop_codon:yes gene_type:complete